MLPLQCRYRWKAFYTVSVTMGWSVHHTRVNRSAGFSVLMFIGTIWALTYNRRMQDINRPFVVVAVLLLNLSTAVSSRLTPDVIC